MDARCDEPEIGVLPLERSRDGYFLLDHRLVIVYVNGTVERWTGRRPDAIVGRTIRQAFPEVRDTPLEAACRQALAQGRPVETEVMSQRDGRRYNIRVYPERNRLSVYSHDVTEWRLHQLTQAAERRWLRVIHQGRPVHQLTATLIADLQRAVRYGSAAALWAEEDGLRLDAGQERMEHLFSDPSVRRLDVVQSPATAAVFEGLPIAVPDLEEERRWRWFREAALGLGFRSACMHPVTDHRGVVVGVVAVCMDYPLADGGPYLHLLGAAARAWSAALERQREATYLHLIHAAEHEAAPAMVSRGDPLPEPLGQRDRMFLMGSHELRNGLASIQGSLDILQKRSQQADAVPSSEVGRIVRMARRATAYLLELFEATLHTAGMPPATESAPATSLNLAVLVAETARQYQAVSESHRILVRVDDAEVYGYWNAQRLRYVLGNLLSNAIKYSADGTSILVSVGIEEDQGVVRVRDEGIGIPAGDICQVFLPYHRGSNAVDKPGSGIGLALALDVVKSYRGTIEVSGNETGGTTFTVRLPLDH